MRGGGLYLPVREPLGLGVRIGVERAFDAGAWPEAAAAHLVAVRELHHPVGAVGRAAGMQRSAAAREAANSQVETAPEEMHGTRLADEAGSALRQRAGDVSPRRPEAMRRAPVVR